MNYLKSFSILSVSLLFFFNNLSCGHRMSENASDSPNSQDSCAAQKAAIVKQVESNLSCSSASDCQELYLSCAISPGKRVVNKSIDRNSLNTAEENAATICGFSIFERNGCGGSDSDSEKSIQCISNTCTLAPIPDSCPAQIADLQKQISANLSCTHNSDCKIVPRICGITKDHAVNVSFDLNKWELSALEVVNTCNLTGLGCAILETGFKVACKSGKCTYGN